MFLRPLAPWWLPAGSLETPFVFLQTLGVWVPKAVGAAVCMAFGVFCAVITEQDDVAEKPARKIQFS